MNEAAVLAALGINATTLAQLLQNVAFPKPIAGIWNSTAISNFAATMASAIAAWPNLTVAEYASANWSLLASTTPGIYMPSPGGLMDGAERAGVLGDGSRPVGIHGRGRALFD
jgi:hypothetical protein